MPLDSIRIVDLFYHKVDLKFWRESAWRRIQASLINKAHLRLILKENRMVLHSTGQKVK